MDDSELRDTLEQLHTELEQTENLDEDSRRRLEHLMGDIRSILDRQAPPPGEHYRSLGEQLSDGILRYEISHPALASAMRHALDILSGAGI